MIGRPIVSMYFNGEKVHHNVRIQQVWGGPNSGIDGGNDGGKGITDISAGTVDFGASDAPMTTDQASKCGGCLTIPISLSAAR